MTKTSQVEQAMASRDLAKRARRLAGTFMDGPDKDRLLQYASELEAQAAELEAARPVTQPQQQAQQQQAPEPVPKPKTPT